MTDYTELKRAAEAAQYDSNNTRRELIASTAAFFAACIPEQILDLIAENERLSGECEGCPMQAAEELRVQVDQLKAENAGLKTGYQAYERVNAELKAENGLLRQLASDTGLELRKASSWICREVEAGTKSATHWAVRLREKADHIDAAMGRGEQS